MESKSPLFDDAFIEKQYRYLIRLRAALVAAAEGLEIEETSVNTERHTGPAEREDDAQRLTMLEIDGLLVAHDAVRLARVERTLQKIAEGSYGLSDVSGKAITRARLEAFPEAVCTLAEEFASEQRPKT
jgi:DnaK suppressor protein